MSDPRPLSTGHAIYHQLVIAAKPVEVYAAVTEPGHLDNWWPLRSSGKPEAGTHYRFFFGPDYDWRAEVVTAVAPTAFRLRMTAADADWAPTSFAFSLSEHAGGKTLLDFQHVDWPEANAHFRRSSFCWAMLLNGLKAYVETGTVIPFGERA